MLAYVNAPSYIFTSDLADVGTYTISVQIEDDDSAATGSTLSATETFTITIFPNSAPYFITDFENQSMAVEEELTYILPTWSDADVLDTLTPTILVNAGSMPDFMTFYSETLYFMLFEPGP